MTARSLITLAIIALFLPGCRNADWNWNVSWWRKPNRVLKPNEHPKDARRESRRDEQPNTRTATPSGPATPTPRSTPTPTPTQTPTPPPQKVVQPETVVVNDERNQPFHYLYLLSPGTPVEDNGHKVISLQRMDSPSCARLLEMLYVPLGRLGSTDEKYLFYEQREEFEAAVRMVSALDVTPAESPSSSGSTETALASGVALYAGILRAGAIVEDGWVNACEQALRHAQTTETARERQWVAAILLGRLLADYRFDYPAARRAFAGALQVSGPGTMEAMTAKWWTADCLVQEGNTREADSAYQDLLDNYEDRWPKSQIIERSETILRELRSR